MYHYVCCTPYYLTVFQHEIDFRLRLFIRKRNKYIDVILPSRLNCIFETHKSRTYYYRESSTGLRDGQFLILYSRFVLYINCVKCIIMLLVIGSPGVEQHNIPFTSCCGTIIIQRIDFADVLNSRLSDK